MVSTNATEVQMVQREVFDHIVSLGEKWIGWGGPTKAWKVDWVFWKKCLVKKNKEDVSFYFFLSLSFSLSLSLLLFLSHFLSLPLSLSLTILILYALSHSMTPVHSLPLHVLSVAAMGV